MSERIVLASLLVATACAPNGDLGGSIGGNYDLRFDRVRAYWLASDLVIIYERDYSPSLPSTSYGDPVANQVVRVTFHTEKQALDADVDIPFEHDEGGALAVSAERYVLADQTGGLVQEPQLPGVFEAKARFDALGRKEGKRIVGELECTFVDDRFLWGTFDTTVSTP